MAQERHTKIFAVFHRAILDRKQMTFRYGGRRREVCPHILGHTKGEEKVLAYQFGGTSSSRLPARGEWRCFALSGVSDIETRTGAWHSGSQHRTSQHCIDVVYVDVNTDVPDQPGRRPGELPPSDLFDS